MPYELKREDILGLARRLNAETHEDVYKRQFEGRVFMTYGFKSRRSHQLFKGQ